MLMPFRSPAFGMEASEWMTAPVLERGLLRERLIEKIVYVPRPGFRGERVRFLAMR